MWLFFLKFDKTVIAYADKFENTSIPKGYEWFIAFYTATVVITCKFAYELSGIDTVCVQNYRRGTEFRFWIYKCF